MLSPDALRNELERDQGADDKPFNVNFFCHAAAVPDAARETLPGVRRLAPYYRGARHRSSLVFPTGAGRAPFSDEAADVLERFKPQW